MDKISIITTFYNAENFIDKSVESVLNQRTDDIQIEYINSSGETINSEAFRFFQDVLGYQKAGS